MARNNYKFEKRRKEIAKKQKKEEKRLKKLAKKDPEVGGRSEDVSDDVEVDDPSDCGQETERAGTFEG